VQLLSPRVRDLSRDKGSFFVIFLGKKNFLGIRIRLYILSFKLKQEKDFTSASFAPVVARQPGHKGECPIQNMNLKYYRSLDISLVDRSV
jgi:hypothetical protein